MISSLSVALAGCAMLSPTADPIVVRAQQSETVGYATLHTFVTIEKMNGEFYKSNAPAMHAYAEWLRAPQVINGTNVYPRGIAFMMSLGAVLAQYKVHKVDSNQVVNVLATVETAINQAQWYISSTGAMSLTNK